MCCLNSLAAVMPFVMKDEITKHIVPIFLKGAKDDIPNVQFCVSKIITKNRGYIDSNVYATQLHPVLKDMTNSPDKDVAYFA